MSLIPEYPARLVCRLLDFPRCQLYRTAEPRPDPDAALREALVRLAGQWPTYGYRRLTAMLKREGIARVDVMKIDVEGFEDAVLQTFFEKGERALFPRAVLIEHCNSFRWKWDCIAHMLKIGYVQEHRDKANVFLTLPG